MLWITFVFGLLVGSFVNAAVYRIYRKTEDGRPKPEGEPSGSQALGQSGLSLWRGRSICPNCKHVLAPHDLIPVISWILLGGKCRYCKKPISIQYPLVEAVTAGLFAVSFAALNPALPVSWINFAFWLYFLTVLIILAVYDLRWYLLPDVVLVPAIMVAVARLVFVLGYTGNLAVLRGPLLAAGITGGIFYVLVAVSKGKWMGGGDIKLVFFMGLILGLRKIALALMIGFNSAAVVGLLLILLHFKKRRDHIPFGPFLVGGTIVAMLYGDQIIGWYLRLSGLPT